MGVKYPGDGESRDSELRVRNQKLKMRETKRHTIGISASCTGMMAIGRFQDLVGVRFSSPCTVPDPAGSGSVLGDWGRMRLKLNFDREQEARKHSECHTPLSFPKARDTETYVLSTFLAFPPFPACVCTCALWGSRVLQQAGRGWPRLMALTELFSCSFHNQKPQLPLHSLQPLQTLRTADPEMVSLVSFLFSLPPNQEV